MAVPSSGTLNQLGLAQECLNGTMDRDWET